MSNASNEKEKNEKFQSNSLPLRGRAVTQKMPENLPFTRSGVVHILEN